MGRTALYLVMGLAVVFGIIAIKLDQSRTDVVKIQMNYLKYTVARNIAHNAVNLEQLAIDKYDTLYIKKGATLIGAGSFYGGTYKDTTRRIKDTIWITSAATYEGQKFTIKLKVIKAPNIFPKINGALGFNAPDINFSMSGGTVIDGRNYTKAGLGAGLVGSGDLTGVSVLDDDDSATVKSGGGPRIHGNPQIKVDTAMTKVSDYLDAYNRSADYRYGPGTYIGAIEWGSESNPKIVVCDAPNALTSITFKGTVTGFGILVVRGNLELAGHFTFRGIVIVYGDNSAINVSATVGTSQVIGGMLLEGGSGSSFAMKGTSNIVYSSEVLAKIKMMDQLQHFDIRDWYE